MIALLDWFVLLVRVGLSVGLIVVIAMNARRVGRGAWFLATLPALHVVMIMAFRVLGWMKFENAMGAFNALRVVDAGMTMLTAMMLLVGLWILRGG